MGLSVPLIWSSGDLIAGTGALRSQETVHDCQHGRSLAPAWATLISREVDHQLQMREEQSGLGAAAGEEEGRGWAGAGLDGHAHNISLTARDLQHPSCFSSLGPLPVPHARSGDHLGVRSSALALVMHHSGLWCHWEMLQY